MKKQTSEHLSPQKILKNKPLLVTIKYQGTFALCLHAIAIYTTVQHNGTVSISELFKSWKAVFQVNFVFVILQSICVAIKFITQNDLLSQ